ncbi:MULTISPECIES: molybdopterin-guanine dinucleotide biosynthesis protein B [Thiorhodovibrio]|uniref:molybdopterin-guanine dinucleotide biosynthesis protein B n=1 Tax=Thiorhodovibrio TaxID=61593 RepID=UPI001912060F|nr:molybdopterin-guanine dinucleotide biosynthesis protein B [Thiorhodovibrio litoralis]WPL14076.1 Molybdopterin-guanine dinucleotide biosynthesis protein B [Thiorhodovibrio litoralis]
MTHGIAHVGFAAPSGTGKTTLLAQLVPVLRARGLRLGYLKHAHHGFDLDVPGKDSFRLRAAGAGSVLIASSQRWALLQEGFASGQQTGAPGFEALLSHFDPELTDLILIEGWHGASFPRIAVHRLASGCAFSNFDDPDLIAVASDAPDQVPVNLPLLPLNQPEAIADFLLQNPRIGIAAQGPMARGRHADHGCGGGLPPRDLREQLVFYYRLLRRYGFNDAQSGNASVRTDTGFLITPSGAGGDDLRPEDLLPCSVEGPIPAGASFDAGLHQAVYRSQPQAQGILHSHGAYSIAASCAGKSFEPADFEGRHYFSQVPIVPIPESFEAYCALVPERVAAALGTSPVAMVATHGVYAWGESLRQAYQWTCALEHSAKIRKIVSTAA